MLQQIEVAITDVSINKYESLTLQDKAKLTEVLTFLLAVSGGVIGFELFLSSYLKLIRTGLFFIPGNIKGPYMCLTPTLTSELNRCWQCRAQLNASINQQNY